MEDGGLEFACFLFPFSVGSRGRFLTSQQIIILNFLEQQGKLEQEKLRKCIQRDSIQKLGSIEVHTDVSNQGGSLTLFPA